MPITLTGAPNYESFVRSATESVTLRRVPAPRVLSFHHPDYWHTLFADLAELPWIGVNVPGQPHSIAICLGEADDGRLVATGLLIDPGKNLEVTSRLLRDVRLGELVSTAAVSPFPIGRVKHSTRRRVRKARPGPAGHPDEFYARVADAYRRAIRMHPRTPVIALMDELGVSEATTHRYLQECRRRGLLDQRARRSR